MNDSKISVRYAKALFESALEQEVPDKVKEDMQLVIEVNSLVEFQHMLINPVVKESEKIRLTEKVLLDKIQPLTLSMLKLVIRNGREQFISGIARNYIELYRKHKGISSAVFTSAQPADNELKKRIEKVIVDTLKQPVDLATETEKDLIGGFILRIGDQQYDASVASNLRKVRKQLLKTNVKV